VTLPAADEQFLAEFARGLFELADRHGVALVGGDTTGGPLVASVQALGTVARGAALTRSGARPGDLLYVSGTPGDAAAGLQLLQGAAPTAMDPASRHALEHRFLLPTPRVELGRALVGIATACIDVSDGLAADAGRLASASGCGLRIDAERLHLSRELAAFAGDAGARRMALTGGEDCELCFTAPPAAAAQIAALQVIVKCPLTCIGSVEAGSGTDLRDHGRPLALDTHGFDHFAGT
jgi:thiamine-monophosphate kinase